MDILWSASTTMRNPERTQAFLQTAKEIEGEVWNDDTQNKYQILLIKNRFYAPTAKNLSEAQVKLLNDYTHKLTYDEAADIFASKHYVDESMRGRTSFDPLEKLGLVSLNLDDNGVARVRVTNFGRMFLDGKIDLSEMVFVSLLKTQFPYPLSDGRGDYNIKPFIGTLHLIHRVNELWATNGENPVGISREEFGIFVLSLKNHRKIDETAERLIGFRRKKREIHGDKERSEFVSAFIADYLSNFENAEKNIREYTDNMVRYLRLTRYIYIRGGGYYIDLEPRRMIEINAILEQDDGSARVFVTAVEYTRYISDYNAYTLPFETPLKLREIVGEIIAENAELCRVLNIAPDSMTAPTDTDELKLLIAELRERRTVLQNLLLKQNYQAVEKIDDAIDGLTATLSKRTPSGNKPSVELEKWANVALNILNDATLIKPNAPLGDDNEPMFTAPANMPDIECYYDGFGAICEVTMLTGRDQWYNEGQPVMRHLRSFESGNDKHPNYCLFVAPRLHTDTVNTFWTAVKYEYEGQRQKIVPITITVLVDILQAVKTAKSMHKAFTRDDLRSLYDACVDISGVRDSTKWRDHITQSVESWSTELLR
jgi:hypothetical protein